MPKKKKQNKKARSKKTTGKKKAVAKKSRLAKGKKKTPKKKVIKKKKITKASKKSTKKKKLDKKSTKKKTTKNLAKKPAKKKATTKPAKKILKKTKPAIKDKTPTLKKQEIKKSEKPTKQAKAKSFSPSLNYREKELQKLLDKEKEEKLILKDMKGRTYCAVENCDYPAIVEGHCRIHFFGLFKMIKKKNQILEQDLLTKNYQLLINKHSSTVFSYLFKDLSSDKSFRMAIKKITGDEGDDLDSEEAF